MAARGAYAIAVLCALAAGRAARADSVADEADFRFHRGVNLYARGRTEDALSEFLASNRLVRNRNVIQNVARCFERLRMYNEAWRWYSDLLAEPLPETERRDLAAALERLQPSLALLRIFSDPPGATVYLDRKDLGARGQTPITLALPPGAATAIVEATGHKRAEARVQLQIGKISLLQLALPQVQGEIEVDGWPRAFELRMDRPDAPVQLAASGRARLPAGPHLLHVSAPGHVAQQLAVEVPAEATAQVSFKLLALPPPSGTLIVRANVDGALVRVDGKEMGFTPGVIDNLPVGTHQIEVMADGRETAVERLEVEANVRRPVDVKLRYAVPRVVAAEKSLTRAQDAPASVTVISGEEIRGFGYTTLSEALRAVRGFYTSSDRDYDSTGVRGFSSPGTYNNRILVLSDGHVTNDVSVGQGAVGRDFDADLSGVERIEIVRGPGSVLYGSAAFFAVVNVVHRAPAEGRHAEVGAQVGTLGENTGHAIASWAGAGGSLWARASGADLSGEPVFASPAASGPAAGFARGLDGERAGHLDLRARAGELTLSGSYNWRRKALPTAAFDTVFAAPGTQTTDLRGFLEAQVAHAFANGLGIDARAAFDAERYRGDWQYRSAGAGYDSSLENWGTAELRFRLPAMAGHRVFVGGEIQDRFRIHVLSVTPGKQTFDNGPGNPAGAPDSEVIYSAYAGDDWRISPRLLLDAAVRIDDYADSFGAVVNPRIALIAQPYAAGTTKLLFGRAFRAPGIYERFFNDGGASQIAARDLRPERVTTVELEHAHQLSEEVSLLVAGYLSRIEKLIRAAPAGTLPDGTVLSQFQNREGFVHGAGAEAEVRWTAGPGAMFSAWYAWSRVRDDTGTGLFRGAPIPNSPEHTGAVRVLYPVVPQVLSVSTEAVYGGPRHTVADSTEPDRLVGESLQWNAGLSGEYARWNLRYGAFVYDLLDQRVSLPGGPEIPFPGHAVPQIGRTLRLQVGASF
ncbi:MAG TPA: TonB-dependent receptor [Myxococcales bacterium]|nr:TonB-dependent receptor [Myxococcales bacterium]